MVEKIATGIEGLDTLLRGGLPKGSVIEVCGTPGTGKSTLAMQFLLQGNKSGEKGLYVSMEQSYQDIINSFSEFNWDISKYVEKKMLIIMWAKELPRSDAISSNELNPARIIQTVKQYGIQRVVIDSLNVFKIFAVNRANERTFLMELIRNLKKENTTSLFISERKHGIDNIEFQDSDYFLDGIIFLDKMRVHDVLHPAILVVKMRGIDHDTGIRPITISKDGISVHADNKIFV